MIMAADINADKVLDLKGLACPMPVIKLSKAIKEVEVGQIIEATATDKGSLTDFPAWAKTSGNEIVEIVEGDAEFKFYVKRTA
jgi:TusA-related sulfurtransferase